MREEQKSEERDSLVYEDEEAPFVGEGHISTGIHGEDDDESLADRARKIESKKRVYDWKPCIPCSRCYRCIQIRQETPTGKMVTRGYLCPVLEGPTDAYHTCSEGYVAKDGRVRIFIDRNPMCAEEFEKFLGKGGRGGSEEAVSAMKKSARDDLGEAVVGRLYPMRKHKGVLGGSEYAPKFDTKAGAAKKRRLMN